MPGKERAIALLLQSFVVHALEESGNVRHSQSDRAA